MAVISSSNVKNLLIRLDPDTYQNHTEVEDVVWRINISKSPDVDTKFSRTLKKAEKKIPCASGKL